MKPKNELTQQIIKAIKAKDFNKVNELSKGYKISKRISEAEFEVLLKEVLFPLYLKPYPINTQENYDETMAVYWADTQIQNLLYDSCNEHRRWLRESLEFDIQKGNSLTEFLKRQTDGKTEPISENPEDILNQIAAHYKYPEIIELPKNVDFLFEMFLPYFSLMEQQIKQDPYIHLPITWKVFKRGQITAQQLFYRWFKDLENKRLIEPNFGNSITQAIELVRWLEKKHYQTITKDDFYQWIQWLDHTSALWQALAGRLLGYAYSTDHIEEKGFQAEKEIPLLEILELIYQKQVEGKFVAGGFIDGIDNGMSEGLHSLQNHPTIIKTGFDVKKWVLKIAINSPTDGDPYLPSAQAFWFYVHEFFDFDPQAVHQLIDAKKYYLAMMCATESSDYGSFEQMQPVLIRLSEEAPPEIAETCKKVIERNVNKAE